MPNWCENTLKIQAKSYDSEVVVGCLKYQINDYDLKVN